MVVGGVGLVVVGVVVVTVLDLVVVGLVVVVGLFVVVVVVVVGLGVVDDWGGATWVEVGEEWLVAVFS